MDESVIFWVPDVPSEKKMFPWLEVPLLIVNPQLPLSAMVKLSPEAIPSVVVPTRSLPLESMRAASLSPVPNAFALPLVRITRPPELWSNRTAPSDAASPRDTSESLLSTNRALFVVPAFTWRGALGESVAMPTSPVTSNVPPQYHTCDCNIHQQYHYLWQSVL